MIRHSGLHASILHPESTVNVARANRRARTARKLQLADARPPAGSQLSAGVTAW